MTGPRTVWRLVSLYDAGRIWQGLDVQVVAETTADVVVDAIERAARDHGIRLERVMTVDEPAPKRATSPARAAGSSEKGTA